MSKPTKRLVRESRASNKDIISKFENVDLTGEPYLSDALAFLTQAGVMLEKQLVVMGGGTATPSAKPAAKPEEDK